MKRWIILIFLMILIGICLSAASKDVGDTSQCIVNVLKREETALKNSVKKAESSGDMVLVKGGTFMMGDTMNEKSGECYDEEKPVHKVNLTYNYYMGRYEVKQGEYKSLMGSNPSAFKNGDNYPVEQVTWWDAIKYCNAKGKREGLAAAYNESTGELLDGNGNVTGDIMKVKGYRLPTEAEWEYAARERGKSVRFGNGKNAAKAGEINFDAKSNKYSYNEAGEYRGKTMSVGSFAPNELGLYDMSGNVREWCSDWCDWYYSYTSGEQTNPYMGQKASGRVSRGGNWGSNAGNIRAANRNHYTPDFSYYGLGFRLARTE